MYRYPELESMHRGPQSTSLLKVVIPVYLHTSSAMARPSYIVSEEKQRFYREHGWVMLEDFISSDEVARIRSVLDGMVSGRISTARRRGDLGGHADRVDPGVENIIQISWPTDLTSELDESEYMRASRDVSEQLYGDPRGTWAMDMNQFLVKMVRQVKPRA